MLLDSNILIYGANGANPGLDAILDRTDLAAASVTRIETIGFHRLSEIERVWLETTFDRMKILPLDDAVAARAIALRQERRMGLADAIIAATALVHNLPLVTRNEEDFEHVTGLRVVNPFAPAS
jgi:predicted nucleic acid-binding protein